MAYALRDLRNGPTESNMAEVDGNRTRRTGITRPTRFEGGGAHQVLGHLPVAAKAYCAPDSKPPTRAKSTRPISTLLGFDGAIG